MDNLQIDELKMLNAAMNALEASARSDEPHWAHTPEFSELRKKIRNAIEEDERLTLEKRQEEAEDRDRSSSNND
jgi:hypothetical protein